MNRKIALAIVITAIVVILAMAASSIVEAAPMAKWFGVDVTFHCDVEISRAGVVESIQDCEMTDIKFD